MGKYPSGPTSCSSDPACVPKISSFDNPVLVSIFAFWCAVTCLCCAFQLWKFVKMKRWPVKTIHVHRQIQNSTDDSKHFSKTSTRKTQEDVVVNVQNEEVIKVTGYRSSYLGEACYYICCFTSVHWIVLHIVILFDAYNKCEVGSIDNLCFYGNHPIFGDYDFNGEVFFVVWWLSAIWFSCWVGFRKRIRLWFRVPCEVAYAIEVYVWTKNEEQLLSMNDSILVTFVRYARACMLPPEMQGRSEIIKIGQTRTGQRFFVFEGHRFLLKGNSIQETRFKVGDVYSDFYQRSTGLTTDEANDRLEEIGLNEIPFKPESLLYTIVDQTFTFFHVYQLISYILQFWSSYLFVAALMAFIVMLSASITIYTRRRSQFAIAKITKYVTEAEVLRDGIWCITDSRHLVPGDVVRLKNGWILPCDLLIIRGSCVCDESSLTGEPMPVQKYFAPNSSSPYLPNGLSARHTLFAGTTVLQAGNQNHSIDVQAIVTATGMATSKGELVSTILYPQTLIFKYDEELPIVVCLLLTYAVVCFIIAMILQNRNGSKSTWVTKWIYCMYTFNQIMNPLLPVALEVGQLHAIDRLKKCQIFCLNPKRIAIAGKIRLFCFDKTGTLTKEGLDFIGVKCMLSSEDKIPTFGPLLSPEKGDQLPPIVLHGLATCHAVTQFGKDFVGNQVEVKMFSSIGWELVERPNAPPMVSSMGQHFHIIKRNEFDQSRATMSVIVKDGTGRFSIYCKGSFEKIKELCDPQSVPEDYLETARLHALQGCYVLGLAYRTMEAEESEACLTRDQMETNLQFVSLILFRNELKLDSRAAIEDLKAGQIRPVMITGDNAQCGHYIAYQSGMLATDTQVFLGDVGKDESIEWSTMSYNSEISVQSMATEEFLSEHGCALKSGAVELAVTGKAFNVLRMSRVMDKLLLRTRIFARFTPSDKVEAVTMFRNHGLIVGMCGDGGNDCGALRTAHAGIALSTAEASVVSPFTAGDKTVRAVVDLLREARAALHTSFACYKFLIIYGLMFSIFKLCAYWYGIIACQLDYIFIDGVAVLSLGYAMTRSHPERKLNQMRPTSSLLGALNVASITGVWVNNIAFLIGASCYMANQKEYVQWPARYAYGASWWTLGDNWESTVLFFTMYFQFIASAFVFSFGATYRRNVFNNMFLIVAYGGIFLICSFALLLPHSDFTELWHVASEQFNRPNSTSPVWSAYQRSGGSPSPAMPFPFRLKLWCMMIGSLVSNICWQKIIVEGPLAKLVATKYPSHRPKFHM